MADDRNYNLPHSNIDLNSSTKLLKGQAVNILLISTSVDTFGHDSARQEILFWSGIGFSLSTNVQSC